MANSVPFRQGPLRESIWYPEGLVGGIIEYNSPYAHYMYTGEKYAWVDGSDKKVPTGQKLHYYTEGTGDHWDQTAAEKYGDQWLQGVANAFIRSL